MKYLILTLLTMPLKLAHADVAIVSTPSSKIIQLAKNNGFKPSMRVVNAILEASKLYRIDPLELTAIGILETGLGKYAKTRRNSNDTFDKGVFQINTVNVKTCLEYNLDTVEGNALCAAKLLSRIKSVRADYMGVYHSKTPSKKNAYLKKIAKVLETKTDKLSVAIND